MYKKSVLYIQSCFFFVNQTYCLFGCFCCCRHLTFHDFIILFQQTIHFRELTNHDDNICFLGSYWNNNVHFNGKKETQDAVSQHVNDDIEYKHRCKTVRSQQVFLRWHLKIVEILIFLSHTSHFIRNEEFLVLPDFSHGKILTFRTKIIQLST